MSATNVLVTIGVAAQAVIVALLVHRRTYKILPVFFFYVVCGLLGDGSVLLYGIVTNHRESLMVYEIDTYVDLTFQYLVLMELAWSILRPMKLSLPKGLLVGMSLVIAAGIFLTWHLFAIPETYRYTPGLLFAVHAQQSFAVLRILFFLLVACCSQILRIGWRDRELQIATGWGFYSLVSLAGIVVHSHQTTTQQYTKVDFAVACSYVLSLVYWVYSFAHKEAPKRELPPEMQDFLSGMSSVMHKQLGRLSENKLSS